MLTRPLNAYERMNYQRRVPSTQVLTRDEASFYTGIFASRGYDTANAYNYHRERVMASRTGYLRGMGAEEPSWWDRLWGSIPAPSSDAEGIPSVDCTGRSTADCLALIEAARGRTTTTEEERSSSEPAPPPGRKMNTYLWIGAGIVGIALLMRSMQR